MDKWEREYDRLLAELRTLNDSLDSLRLNALINGAELRVVMWKERPPRSPVEVGRA